MDVVVGNAVLRAAQESIAHGAGLRRILAVFNPAAGRNHRDRFDQIIKLLRDFGCFVSVVETTAPGHAETIAREASANENSEFDVIVAAGGDGTVNEIVNGLSGTTLALGLIPLGTANVLANEIGLARSGQAIARALAKGPIRSVHLGRINERRFVMMAGAGFDANVVSGVSLALKKVIGPLAYVWQAAVQAFREDHAGCRVTIDGVPYQTVSVVICNGRRYGGPFIAVPDASLTEDRFHVLLMQGRGWINIARYGVNLILGRIGKLSDVLIVPGREVQVDGIEGRPVQADGDIIARLPARISVDPEPVHLIFPAA
jgi:diacylglycerol kinase (ATP)